MRGRGLVVPCIALVLSACGAAAEDDQTLGPCLPSAEDQPVASLVDADFVSETEVRVEIEAHLPGADAADLARCRLRVGSSAQDSLTFAEPDRLDPIAPSSFGDARVRYEGVVRVDPGLGVVLAYQVDCGTMEPSELGEIARLSVLGRAELCREVALPTARLAPIQGGPVEVELHASIFPEIRGSELVDVCTGRVLFDASAWPSAALRPVEHHPLRCHVPEAQRCVAGAHVEIEVPAERRGSLLDALAHVPGIVTLR